MRTSAWSYDCDTTNLHPDRPDTQLTQPSPSKKPAKYSSLAFGGGCDDSLLSARKGRLWIHPSAEKHVSSGHGVLPSSLRRRLFSVRISCNVSQRFADRVRCIPAAAFARPSSSMPGQTQPPNIRPVPSTFHQPPSLPLFLLACSTSRISCGWPKSSAAAGAA